MSSFMFRNAPEKDVLQMNMETISKELSDLMVTCEKEFGVTQQDYKGSSTSNGVAKICGKCSTKLDDAQNMSKMTCQKKEHVYTSVSQVVHTNLSPSGPIAKHDFNLPNIHRPKFESNPGSMNPYGHTYPCVYPGPGVGYIVGTDRPHSSLGPSYGSNQYACLPPYEFHYLRPQRDAGRVTSAPLISLTAKEELGGRHYSGSYRKYPKSHTKLNLRAQNGNLNYDNIVVDLTMLGLSKDGKNANPVLRLFGLFRDMHNAIAEVPPLLEPLSDSAYEPTFAPLPKATIPRTMNVQFQVKHASCQVVSFICAMHRLVVANVMYDQKLAAECGLYIYKLRQVLNQFEMYKFIELEHKRGQFISEDVRVHAEHLEKLMEQINGLIREVHIRVIAYDWYIGKKYRRETGLKMAQPPVNKYDSPTMKRSKIGIINEILQLWETAISMTATNTATTTINAAEAASSVVSTAALNIKPVMNVMSNENKGELANTAIAAIGTTATNCLSKSTATATAFNAHVRQPVFYIG